MSGHDLDFEDIVRRYRRELHVYCYRMLGSLEEAEDHVQEVFARAWRSRANFRGRSSARTWLYRIATNACLDTLRRDTRRAAGVPPGTEPSIAAMPWLQPYPDTLLDELGAQQTDPEATAVSRETISLAFLAAIQLLPPRQRAVLILRDVLALPAREIAALTETTVPAVNSALQRAHAKLRQRWPGGRLDWAPSAEPDAEQSKLLQRYIDAHELADAQALIDVLHDDVRLSISPAVGQWTGRDEVEDALRPNMNILGRWRLLPITANRQPGAAVYLRRPDDDAFRPFAICVLRIAQGKLIDIAAFEHPSLFPAFGLPPSL